MAKNKKNIIPHYEMLFIIPNQFTEDELPAILKKVDTLIADNGGAITYREEWGKKRLSYPIKHNNYGYYFLVEFDMEGARQAKFNNVMKLASDILRYQIVSIPSRTPEEIRAEKEQQQEQVKRKFKEEKEKLEKEKQVVSADKKTTAKKVNLEDLDEKLDKILDTNDLL